MMQLDAFQGLDARDRRLLCGMGSVAVVKCACEQKIEQIQKTRVDVDDVQYARLRLCRWAR